MPEQPDNMEIGNTGLDCGHCGTFQLDRVFLDTDDGTLEWLACPHCGWEDRPDAYEPHDWYHLRYLGVDDDTLQELREFMNEPLDLGFPEGYRPAEF